MSNARGPSGKRNWKRLLTFNNRSMSNAALNSPIGYAESSTTFVSAMRFDDSLLSRRKPVTAQNGDCLKSDRNHEIDDKNSPESGVWFVEFSKSLLLFTLRKPRVVIDADEEQQEPAWVWEKQSSSKQASVHGKPMCLVKSKPNNLPEGDSSRSFYSLPLPYLCIYYIPAGTVLSINKIPSMT